MKLVIVGTGYVGLITGACFAEFGYNVICVDKNNDRINKLNNAECPFYEPGLENLLLKHLTVTKLLSFTNSLSEVVADADIIFITVGTPTKRVENQADLSSVWEVAEEIGKKIFNYTVVVTKSTVPVGTTIELKNILSSKLESDKFDVVSNPEFLREGSAINDFLRPDRIVIGTNSKKSENIMKELYRPLYLNETPIVFTNIETSEMIKYASNSFLATKISFINQVADLCEKVGANVNDVAKAMGMDKRIGSKFLHAGPGFGGSCFPKDIKAFVTTAKKYNIDFSILNAVNDSNAIRPINIAKKILESKKYKKGNTIAILGLSFKPNTNDVRDSTSLKIAKLLIEKGIKIKSYDPKAMNNAKLEINELIECKTAYEACESADAVIIATEWNEFRALDFKKIKEKAKKLVIYDLRNIYNPKELRDIGFEYYGIGT